MTLFRSRDHSEQIMGRRGFLRRGIGSLAAVAALTRPSSAVLAAKKAADSTHGRITITDIESHEIHPSYTDFLEYELNHYYGPRSRMIHIVHTDKGFYGLGEGRATPEVLEKYIGTSPFDWVGDETSIAMAIANYDLMGKAAAVPVYKLFGQRYRRWVPVGAWTVSTAPKDMAESVRRYAGMGYTWMKYHLSPFENVFDQLAAMERVAPPGFKLHFDLTRFHHFGHNPDLLERMEKSPIAGCFEDPWNPADVDGYIDLTKSLRLPVLLHGSHLGYSFDVLRRAADGYIIGHAKLGTVMQSAGLFAAANVPFTIQWVGGNMTLAMLLHMQAAFKTASQHIICAAETVSSDVVKERFVPTNGMVRVPESPGLGVTLDRDTLEQLKSNKPPQQPPYIVKSRYKNGTVMYAIMSPPATRHFLILPDRWRLLPLSFDSPVSTEYWDDDGSPEYKAMFQRLEKEEMVLERE